MKKVAIVTHPFYNNNKLFDLNDPIRNRDNCLHSFSVLQKTFARYGYDLATSDIHTLSDSDLVIYNEMPDHLSPDHDPEKSFLLLFETELIRPINWDLKRHQNFSRIFTWHDEKVDQQKYFKMNFSHLFPKNIPRPSFADRKLCTLIAGNKMVDHPLELYSERLKSIRWFEDQQPQDFDYYGMGWNQRNFGHPVINKIAKKLKLQKIWPAKASKCYRGPVDSKLETLQKYRFCICYENAKEIPGYITEKIFDCFFAGCIPVYWGAPNITDHIPKACFVDRRDFSSHEALYDHLRQMSEREFSAHLDAIEDFMKGPQSAPFTSQGFSNTLIENVKDQ